MGEKYPDSVANHRTHRAGRGDGAGCSIKAFPVSRWGVVELKGLVNLPERRPGVRRGEGHREEEKFIKKAICTGFFWGGTTVRLAKEKV